MFTVKISRAALFAAFGLLSGSVSAQTAGQAAGCGGRDLQADTWVATDALGRTLPGYAECGPRKTNRTVAMFYFVTHYPINIFSEIPFYELSLYISYLQMFSFGLNTHEISRF